MWRETGTGNNPTLLHENIRFGGDGLLFELVFSLIARTSTSLDMDLGKLNYMDMRFLHLLWSHTLEPLKRIVF